MDALFALSLSWLVLIALLKSIATVALWVCAAIGAICILSALIVMFGWSLFAHLVDGLDPHPSEGGR